VTGRCEWGHKLKPPKMRFEAEPPKILWTNVIPPKHPILNFGALENSLRFSEIGRGKDLPVIACSNDFFNDTKLPLLCKIY